MKDYALEMLAIKDEKAAMAYIGNGARSKNIFEGNKIKRKNNHSDDYLPLFAINPN